MKPLRCGLIGYGAWGQHHARVIAGNPRAQLVAITSRTEATRARAQHDHPSCVTYRDYRALLQRDDLDAMVVVLPSHLHAEAALAALESNRHLLLEKPMCLTVADCEALNTAAGAHNRVLAIGHEMRVSSLWGKVKELITNGAIGDPRYMLIELWRKPYRLGADGWRYDIDRVGNWILEEPIHFFDLARWYFEGIAAPESVYARSGARRADRPQLHDYFSASINFAGGRYAVISQSLGGWEHHQTVKVSGTDGALWASWSGAMDRTFEPAFSLSVQHGEALEKIEIPRAAGEVFELETQFARFVHAVQEGAPLAATGTDGAWSVRMCLQAQQSVIQGIPVPI